MRPSDVVLNVKAGNFDCQLRVVDEALQDVERVRPGVVGGLGGVFLAVGDPPESRHARLFGSEVSLNHYAQYALS